MNQAEFANEWLSRSRRWLLSIAGAALCLSAAGLQAAGPHEAGAMDFDGGLSLRELFDAARERHPELGIVGAQRRRAGAENDFASNWLPDSPMANGYHLSDRPLDDIGFYEDEIALSLPLWMPGEKKARTRLADATAAAAESGAAEFEWRVSGEVRGSLWTVLRARRQWELAREQEADLSEILDQARIFEASGEISRGDALAVVQELGTWRAETLALEAAYQDAARGYRALTGVAALPAEYEEVLSPTEEIPGDHPALQQARDRVTEISAQLDGLRKGNNYRPAVQMFWRSNRPNAHSPADSALGIGFEVPLGRSASRKPEVGALDEALARAQAQLLQRQRELQLQLHEAEHDLHTIELQLENSAELMAAAETRRELDALELELGEIPVQEWLRRLASYRAIQREHELLLLRRGAAVAAYNQAVGESL